MREILFRGKRVDNGEWVLGATFATIYQENTVLVFMPQAGESVKADVMNSNDRILTSIHGKFYQVFPATVGQYTGLTDKNGKEIFEGDIVKTHYANAPKAVFVETVVFDGGKFCATSTNDGCKTTAALWDGVPRLAIDKSIYMDEVEVIGNIHDNPELLEVGE